MAPLIYVWKGGAMWPLRRFAERCAEHFVENELYRMDAVEARSVASHNHYFATIHDAWLNLPERYAEDFATEEHLRKHALIRCGHHDERKIVLATEEEALQVAAFVRPMDTYAIVSVQGRVVVEWRAKSQSLRKMGNKVFQQSKSDVLDWLAKLLDTSRSTLEAQNQKPPRDTRWAG